ncbi:MAG TPA: ABC transporter substrate-binding protein [Mycobacteriales bacterium]|nr:ABC transporter substrate-binding protein [Mycobacteriales bacterium]
MPVDRSAVFSRRALLGGTGTAAAALVAGCAGKSAAKSGSDSWSFTDDRKQTIHTDGRPRHIVAYIGSAAVLVDYGLQNRIAGVFGPTKLGNGKPDVQAGDLDIDKVTIIGNTYGEFDLEKYAKLDPDLIVTNMYQGTALWFVPDDAKDKILGQAPAIGFRAAHVSLPEPIRRYEALAKALGADLESSRVRDAKARFRSAASDLRAAARMHGRLRVLAASASRDILYVSDPSVYADLSYFRSLGVDLVEPNKVQGGFFENLSWENADKYPADVILLDNRTAALQPKDLTDKPTWTRLPAVQAGQVTPWLSEPRFSYAGAAPLIESLATALRKGRKVI